SLKIFGKYVFFFNACSASCKIGFSSFVGESAKASCIAVNNFTSEGIFCVLFFLENSLIATDPPYFSCPDFHEPPRAPFQPFKATPNEPDKQSKKRPEKIQV